MKYLINRNKFVENGMKYKSSDNLHINEADNSGPFANDIPWNDSLLGRLINSAVRKANIEVDLNSIKRTASRLRDAFDDLIDESTINGMDDNDKKEYAKILIFTFLNNIKEHVENFDGKKESLTELKNLTTRAISETENSDYLEDKNELKRQLVEFKKFLDTIKDDELIREEETETESTGESQSTGASQSTGSNFESYLNNFKSVLKLITIYEIPANRGGQPAQSGSTQSNGTNTGATVSVNTNNNTNRQNDSYKYFESTNNPTTMLRIRQLYSYIKTEMTIDEINSFLRMSTENLRAPMFKDPIKKIYRYIKRKSGINEDVNSLLSRSESIGEKIFELYQLSKSGNFSGVPEAIKNELIIFNRTMGVILNVSPVSETKLYLKYNKIYEADGGEDGEVSPPQTDVITKVKDWYGKNMDLNRWLLDKAQVDKIRINLDKKLAAKKDSLIIPSMDPILEIVKLFNRAYKLHTTQVIPTGRSGGAVSNKTFREYQSFGGNATPSSAGSSGGPYRNIKIFNAWEEAVLNIKGDKKYQCIFHNETVIKTPEGNVIEKAGKKLGKFMNDLLDGEELYKSGGDKKQGAQAAFLSKYFGYDVKDAGDVSYGNGGDLNINNDNADGIKTKKIMFTKSIFPYSKTEELNKTFFLSALDDISGDSSKPKKVYFYINDIKESVAYISYCESFYFFKNYIKDSGGVSYEMSELKGDCEGVNTSIRPSGINEDYKIKAFKVKVEDLIGTDGNFKVGSRKINYLQRYENGKNSMSTDPTIGGEDKFKFNTFFTLSGKKDDESKYRLKVEKIDKENIRKNSGFPELSISQTISTMERL